MSQAGGLGSDSFENIVHEAVHDAHSLAGNSSVGMHLLQDFVDVDCVTLLPPALLFLVAFRDVLLSLAGLFSCFTAGFGWHFYQSDDDISARRGETDAKNRCAPTFVDFRPMT